MKKNKEYIKNIRLIIVKSQDDELKKVKSSVKNDFNINLSKTELIRIAISELMNNVNNETKLNDILEKYKHI